MSMHSKNKKKKHNGQYDQRTICVTTIGTLQIRIFVRLLVFCDSRHWVLSNTSNFQHERLDPQRIITFGI